MLKELKAAIFILVVIALTIATAHAQRKFAGKVVDVVDGRTCVIELPSGRLTAVLQYIETPDVEQPLHEVVAAHLRSLVIGKSVEFSPRIVMTDRTVGQMLLGGVDIGQQLLRDGAAWHSLPEKSGQDPAERARYEENEAQAKLEKRGVWSIEQLKPTWEYRAEQEAIAAQAEKDAIEKARLESVWKANAGPKAQAVPVGLKAPTLGSGTDLFVNPMDQNQFDRPLGIGGLRQASDPSRNLGWIATPTIFIDFPGAGLVTKANARLVWMYRGSSPQTATDSLYYVAIATGAKTVKFSKTTSFAAIADGKRIDFKKTGFYQTKATKEGQLELIFFVFTPANLQKIAAARKFTLQLGPYSGTISADSMELIRNLANSTSN